MSDKKETKIIDSMYFHISNSGFTFSIQDSGYGPELVVRSSAFGNIASETKYMISPEGMMALGLMLVKAAGQVDHEFSKTYCNAGQTERERDLGWAQIEKFFDGTETKAEAESL